MKVFVISLLILISTSVTSIKAEEQPLSVDGLNLRDAQILVAGVAYGFGVYDTQLTLGGKESLYCAPPENSINGKLLWQLAENILSGPHEISIIAIAAIDELKRKYPCAGG